MAFTAERFHRPPAMEQLPEIVAGSRLVRAVGTGHSFNRMADTSGDCVSWQAFRRRSTSTRSAGPSRWPPECGTANWPPACTPPVTPCATSDRCRPSTRQPGAALHLALHFTWISDTRAVTPALALIENRRRNELSGHPGAPRL
jgi:hypothetical protein